MKTLVLMALIGLMPLMSYANCYGSSSFYSCSDDNGNNYDISRVGNITYVDGYNYNTGSRWSSTSHAIGNTTYQDGRAANGNTWNQTIQRIGNNTFYSGTDSNGNYYNKICNSYGCY